jgi:hypothetical protein
MGLFDIEVLNVNAEKENTFRMLREEELLVTSWLCRFGWHKWTKYRDPETSRFGGYVYLTQYRFCSCCNLADRKTTGKTRA